MKPPVLEVNKCSILIAEYATGHVFKRNLTLFLNGDNEQDVFQLFDNLYSAKYFTLQLIKSKPEFECTIFNYNGEHIATFDITGERKFTSNVKNNSELVDNQWILEKSIILLLLRK